MCINLQRGVMQTHGEETKKFFRHSSVICLLSPRYPSNKLGMVKHKATNSICIANAMS